jgi:hypothetical protein
MLVVCKNVCFTHVSPDGQDVHLLAATDQQAGAVLAQADVDGKTNESSPASPRCQSRWTWPG